MGIALKPAKVRYFTYFLTFPDGETWVKQEPFVHQLEFELRQKIKEHKKDSEWKHRANTLFKKGECWWKDNMDVEHRIVIEERKRPTRWGTAKAGLGSHQGVNT